MDSTYGLFMLIICIQAFSYVVCAKKQLNPPPGGKIDKTASVNASTQNICKDNDEFSAKCKNWAVTGECEKNKGWMTVNCRKSCNRCATVPAPGKCHDNELYTEDCATWEKEGECKKNRDWMSENCMKTCGACLRMNKEL